MTIKDSMKYTLKMSKHMTIKETKKYKLKLSKDEQEVKI